MHFKESQIPPRPTHLAHDIIRSRLRAGDIVIDATTGNGFDTEFLVECVGETGRVLAFDIQASALKSAKQRVGENAWVEFFHASHRTMADHAAEGTVSLVMFNLGYLPGQNHQITTEVGETLETLKVAADLIKKGGIISVICYPGHTEGVDEALEVERCLVDWAEHGWRIAKYQLLGTRKPAPFLLLAVKGCG